MSLPDDRVLHAQVWMAQVGRVPLLLLDSDVAENDSAARDVTDRLYGGGTDHRLMQELLLGVGGVRAIRAFCRITGNPDPEVFHTNEGHAGFLGLERIRELTESRLSFDEALEAVRAGTVFTTHTPVPAGIDRFPVDMIARQFGGGNAWPTVPVERILELGAEADPGRFNMAVMGMRLAQRVNGVSELHGEVSRDMFKDLWPGFDVDEVPIGSITNGVHAPTWVGREFMELARPRAAVAAGAGARLGGRAEDLRRGDLGDQARAPRPPGRGRAGAAAPVVARPRRLARPSWAGSTTCSTLRC
ncbi:alpha-glucan family phosphorylase [Nonomuraea ferruginea]